MPDAPAGFEPWPRSSPFADHAGPLLFRRDGDRLTFGVVVEERHTNARGTAHGGMLATMADLVLGYAAAFSTDPPTRLQTAGLSIDFLSAARPGDFVTASPQVLRVGGRLAHATVTLEVESRVVARASCVSVVDADVRSA
ncbi:MAG TPA: PaaI family thioesterase [Solirubrobacteraceae bacterium]|nr:PaaI family thioesterase [Solirubrobacteraceae bacterium]